MSFLSKLEHVLIVIGKDALAAAPIVGTAVSFVNPPVGTAIIGIAGRVSAMVVSAEQIHKDAGTGQLKAADVMAGFDNVIQAANEANALLGRKPVTYDKAMLQTAINAEVALMNARAALVGSVKEA